MATRKNVSYRKSTITRGGVRNGKLTRAGIRKGGVVKRRKP